MVALAQIDPEAAPMTSSILNLFSDASDAPPSMSEWDQGYLQSLYESEQQSASPRANAAQVADRLAREVDGNDP
jgi:streptomycin 6-kinase